jgi:hypothetical protein
LDESALRRQVEVLGTAGVEALSRTGKVMIKPVSAEEQSTVFFALMVTAWKAMNLPQDSASTCMPKGETVRIARSSAIAWCERQAPPLKE